MASKALTRQDVIDRLIDFHKKGYALTSYQLMKKDHGLYRAVYKGGNNGQRFFNSIDDARAEASRQLREQGDVETAKLLETFNSGHKPAVTLMPTLVLLDEAKVYVDRDGKIPHERTEQAFKTIYNINQFLEQPALVRCSRKDLETICLQGSDQQILGESERIADGETLAEKLRQQVASLKSAIYESNIGLIFGMMRKLRIDDSDSNHDEYEQEGRIALSSAVEKYNPYHGGNAKFNTYACKAISNNIGRLRAKLLRHPVPCSIDISNSETGQKLIFEDKNVEQPYEKSEEEELKEIAMEILKLLTQRERTILKGRYGFDNHGRKATLREVGESIGLTKERVRQIQAKAIRKLREHPMSRRWREVLMER